MTNRSTARSVSDCSRFSAPIASEKWDRAAGMGRNHAARNLVSESPLLALSGRCYAGGGPMFGGASTMYAVIAKTIIT